MRTRRNEITLFIESGTYIIGYEYTPATSARMTADPYWSYPPQGEQFDILSVVRIANGKQEEVQDRDWDRMERENAEFIREQIRGDLMGRESE